MSLGVATVHVLAREIVLAWDNGGLVHGYADTDSQGPLQPYVEDAVDLLSFVFGCALALMLMPAGLLPASPRSRRLVTLAATITIAILTLRGVIGEQGLRQIWGGPVTVPQDGASTLDRSELLRFCITGFSVVLVAVSAAVGHAAYAGSLTTVRTWFRNRALAPAALTFVGMLLGVATVFAIGGVLLLCIAVVGLVALSGHSSRSDTGFR
jgi:hypothetical protein